MRKYDFDFQIDGQPILAPDAGVQISYADIDSEETGRDEAGYMHRIILREKVRTWSFTYAFLDAEEYAYMRSLIDGKAEFALLTRGIDGNEETTVAYCSNHSITITNRVKGFYNNLTFNIIEC